VAMLIVAAVVVVRAVLVVVSVAVVIAVGLVFPLRFQFLWMPVAHEASLIGSG
jgi:hypothetical protein